MTDNSTIQIVATGITSPEGPAADRHGNIYLVSRWKSLVVKVDAAGNVSEVINTGGKPQAVALLPSGDLLVADCVNHALYRVTPTGQATTVCSIANGKPLLGPNDLLIGPDEIVYMTDPGDDMEALGQVVRVDLRTGTATCLADGLLFPNGIALNHPASHLYVAESTRHRVLRYPLSDNGQRIGNAEVFHQFDDFYPDGMAFDSAGNLLVALHGGGVIAVLAPNGRQIDAIPAGGKQCANCVFGGDDFQTLYIVEDSQQALLKTRWHNPGQQDFSRSLNPSK